MTKPTQATIFRKRQILPASGLNKALQDYGSAGGSVPYKTDGTQDESMTAPLGTKSAPFGDAYFKGMNIYSEIEVQALVSAGKLTANDRMVFWDTDTNNLAAWDGSAIVQLGGNGGGGSMDYLFGDGSDGNVTMVSNGNYDTAKNFQNFTLNSGVTLSVTSPLTPLIIRCTGTCTINGTIDMRGKGFPLGQGHGAKGVAPYMISSESGNANAGQVYAKFMALDFTPVYGSGGNAGGETSFGIGFNGGGGGGTRPTEGYGHTYGAGGAGGGYILILAKKIIIAGSILASGGNGQGGNGGNQYSQYVCGGGGGGGCIGFFCREQDITGTVSVAGGTAGTGTSYSANGKAGGAGAFVKVLI